MSGRTLDDPLPVYIGWDKTEDLAFRVARASLLEHSSIPLHVIALRRDSLSWPGYRGIFTRRSIELHEQEYDIIDGKPFSTDFSFTRFLVPVLQQYDGFALFCDCDFLFRHDVADLLDEHLCADFAVSCVHHHHVPSDTVKMDGKIQSIYYRKNWSSFVLWNCSHESNKLLTRDAVNQQTGSWLHSFGWLEHEDIGEIGPEWNWLEGVSPASIEPKAVHFTRGGPWHAGYEHVAYADEWRSYAKRFLDV